ncbi:hypothetical protein ACFQO4_10815 [Saliphagus sp. GCM10025334]
MVDVDSFDDLEYVELRVVGATGNTGIWTAHTSRVVPEIYAITNGNGGNITYQYEAIVTTVYENGESEVLERHTFSCEDVGYKDACEARNESE